MFDDLIKSKSKEFELPNLLILVDADMVIPFSRRCRFEDTMALQGRGDDECTSSACSQI